MKVAYLDTSALVAIAFQEPEARLMTEVMAKYDRLISSNLLEAEFQSALVREGVDPGQGTRTAEYLQGITWVLPDRPLTAEINRICRLGYLRGADLWHLACALFVSPDPSRIDFLSLDARQTEVSSLLGFGG